MHQLLLQSLHPPPQLLKSQPPTTPPPQLAGKFSRRHLAAALPLLATLFSSPQALALSNSCADDTLTTPTKKAFLDVAVDGEPIGRITIALYESASPIAAARFISLLTGAAGISYRRKEFVKITPNYIQHGGVRSYGVDAELAKTTGGRDLAADELMAEWAAAERRCSGTKNTKGSVGIVVRDPAKPPPRVKVVARRGKIEIDEEEVGRDPNGTEFVIDVEDSPEMDPAAVVVGRVVEGMEVVEKIARVKAVQENTASPYFRVAKLIGDKRAVVAERGFNRPFSKMSASS